MIVVVVGGEPLQVVVLSRFKSVTLMFVLYTSVRLFRIVYGSCIPLNYYIDLSYACDALHISVSSSVIICFTMR